MPNVNEIEPNNFTTQASQVSVGDTVEGVTSVKGDFDFYRLDLTVPTALRFTLTTDTPITGFTYEFRIISSTNTMLTDGFLGTERTVDYTTQLAPGTYYMVVNPADVLVTTPYTLKVAAAAGSAATYEVEGNDAIATANPVALGAKTVGLIGQLGDSDYFAVNLTSPGFLSVDFTNTLHAHTVTLYGSDGTPIDSKTLGGASGSLMDGGLKPGQYYIGVTGGFDDNYSFVANGISDSINKTALTPTAAVKGSIPDGNTRQFYTVNLVAGQCYDFSAAGQKTAGGTLPTPALSLFAPTGAFMESVSSTVVGYLANGSKNVSDPHLVFTAPTSGQFVLAVSGQGGSGSYTLTETVSTPASLAADLLNKSTSYNPNFYWKTVPGTSVSLTFAFMQQAASSDRVGFTQMSLAQKQAVRAVLGIYSQYINMSFVEVADPSHANLLFGNANGQGIWGGNVDTLKINPDGSMSQNGVYLANDGPEPVSGQTTPGSFGFSALLHEVGHALGLKHPGDYSLVNGGGATPYLPAGWDSLEFTVMSYFANPNSSQTFGSTPGLLDILALQTLYGIAAFSSTPIGFKVSSSVPVYQSAPMGKPGDAIDASNQTMGVQISLVGGSLSSIGPQLQNGTMPAHDNIGIPFNSKYTVAKGGAGNDLIYGNDLGNMLYGGDGADTITGGTGNDAIFAGNGNDVLFGVGGNDIIDGGGGGVDTAVFRSSFKDYSISIGQDLSGSTVVTDHRSNAADNDGTDTLAHIERLQFKDYSLALDVSLGQSAAKAVLVIGSTVGKTAINNKALDGLIIAYFDTGASVLDGASLLVDSGTMAALNNGRNDNPSFVTFVYANVYGKAPDAATLASLVAPLESKTITQAQWLAYAVESAPNQTNVDLVGLAQTGLQFI